MMKKEAANKNILNVCLFIQYAGYVYNHATIASDVWPLC